MPPHTLAYYLELKTPETSSARRTLSPSLLFAKQERNLPCERCPPYTRRKEDILSPEMRNWAKKNLNKLC